MEKNVQAKTAAAPAPRARVGFMEALVVGIIIALGLFADNVMKYGF